MASRAQDIFSSCVAYVFFSVSFRQVASKTMAKLSALLKTRSVLESGEMYDMAEETAFDARTQI